MAKASLTLPNGTVVQVEGTLDEVRDLLQFYGSAAPRPAARSATPKENQPARAPTKKRPPASEAGGGDQPGSPNLSEIVNLAKNCDEAEDIERHILDRASQVDRTLLPLYVVHEHLGNRFGLSSGEVSKITTDLGVPVSQPNASRTLSGTAAKYVIGDKVRKKGQAVRYKLSRRGVKYLKAVIRGRPDEDAR
jgi:hypothetical protein